MNLNRKIQSKALAVIIFAGLFFVPWFSQGAVPDVEKIDVFQAAAGLKVFWKQPAISESETIILVKKEGQCPDGFYDGQEIYRGNGTEFVDREVEVGKKYCYGAYVYNLAGFSSQMKTSEIVERAGFFGRIGNFFQNNCMIGWGFLVIIALLFINHKTMNEKKRIFEDLKTEADETL